MTTPFLVSGIAVSGIAVSGIAVSGIAVSGIVGLTVPPIASGISRCASVEALK